MECGGLLLVNFVDYCLICLCLLYSLVLRLWVLFGYFVCLLVCGVWFGFALDLFVFG